MLQKNDPFTGMQGGAAAAIMCAAIEEQAGSAFVVASVTTHFLRPVPLAPLQVTATPLRIGRRVTVVDATLAAQSEVCAVQRATLIRVIHESALPTPPPRSTVPERLPLQTRTAPHGERWMMDAMEVRSGADGAIWFRLSRPIVADQRSMTAVLPAADWAHGVTAPLGAARRPQAAIPNPDLMVHLFRPPEGAWIGLESASAWSTNCVGAGWAALYDTGGLIGRVAMSIAVAPVAEA